MPLVRAARSGSSTTNRVIEGRRSHEFRHGGYFADDYMVDTPLGPSPGSSTPRIDRPASVTVVAADETVAFKIAVFDDPSNLDDDQIPAMWEAAVQLAEKLTGRHRDAATPRLENGLHMIRYYDARRLHPDDLADPLSVACQSCGETEGTECS